MHKVKRNKAPQTLIKKQKNTIIKEYNKDDWKLTNKERIDLLDSLCNMYSGCCAYCEASLNITSSAYIDHFRPRSLFPELTFEYNNLNYSCQICNRNKSDSWNKDYFNPSEENPEKHIVFRGLLACKLDDRGQKMIDLLKINETKRLKLKEKTYEGMLYSIINAKSIINLVDKDVKSTIEMAKIKVIETIKFYNSLTKDGSDYCTMIRHNFKNQIQQLEKELGLLEKY